jgi:hypothetical protein
VLIDLGFTALSFAPVIAVKRGRVNLATKILVMLIWLVSAPLMFMYPSGLIATGLGFTFAVLVTGLLISGQAAICLAVVSSVVFAAGMYIITDGRYVLLIDLSPITLVSFVFTFVLVALFVQLAYSTIRTALARVHANEAELKKLAADLQQQIDITRQATRHCA